MKLKSYAEKLIRDPELLIFLVFLAIMSGYYIYRMFSFAPWYDELYTYNFFISRGPVYAGIHWPVPNNHLGYSALSGFLYIITHEPYISLRGISLLSSIGSLIMLFMAGRKLMLRGFALLLPAIYAGAWQVNNITVQGRGYALSVNMMLIALTCLINLCFDEERDDRDIGMRRYYIIWAFSLILGFYTVMTTLYWVVTICAAAFCCLMALKKYKRLIRLVIASVFGAIGTIFVYGIVWLAIGSNLLSKDETGAYFGMYQLDVIKKSPILAAKTGAEYMLATPYIQSVSKEGYVKAFADHWIDIISHMYTFGIVIIILMAVSVLFAMITLISRYIYNHSAVSDNGTIIDTKQINGNKAIQEIDNSKVINALSARTQYHIPNTDGAFESINNPKTGTSESIEDKLTVFSWLVVCFVLVSPLTVFVQTKLPYVRVFTYYAVSISLALSYLIYVLFGALKKYFTYGISIIVCVFAFALIFGKDYNMPYGDREQAILDIMKQSDFKEHIAGGESICLTDCNQEYMYRFLYDEYPDMPDQHDADIIIVDKDMLDPEAEYHWEFYYDYSSIDMGLLADMNQISENSYYKIYEK